LCEATSSSDCGKVEGIKPGLNLGVGFGGLVRPTESIGLRADVLFRGYVINVFALETDSPSAEISRNIRGTRFFVMAGVEL
jgi:hypothetical protein